MRDLSKTYPVWLCDIWGVVHNGVNGFAAACDALSRHRGNGGSVILVTNAPRLHDNVARQLQRLQVPDSAYDRIVTSGDVTRHLIATHGAAGVYHLGPARDEGLFAGLSVARVPLDAAVAVVCTGLFDDTTETAENYEDSLQAMRRRNIEMICANPDKVVRRGSRLIPCAGAIAERFEQIGGKVLMAGKPFAPIYELALDLAAELRGKRPKLSEVLAIGDGPETDIAGAAQLGVDVVLITGGISDAELDDAAIERHVRARVPAAHIVRTLPELAW
jgi:HAD superfamily hydrolase (TIGR01450 family)